MAQVRLTRRRWYFIPALAVLALILAACGGSSGTTSTSPSGAVKSGGSLTFALDEDVAGFNILPATTAGYSQIQSVTSSDNGKTATVVFAKPFGDWQGLFVSMVPAHIAKKVGFNDGFQTFGPAVQVSGGPYMIQSYSKGENLV